VGKIEYKRRLKLLGYSGPRDARFLDALGLGDTTWHNWYTVPDRVVFWLYWREADKALDDIRRVIEDHGV